MTNNNTEEFHEYIKTCVTPTLAFYDSKIKVGVSKWGQLAYRECVFYKNRHVKYRQPSTKKLPEELKSMLSVEDQEKLFSQEYYWLYDKNGTFNDEYKVRVIHGMGLNEGKMIKSVF